MKHHTSLFAICFGLIAVAAAAGPLASAQCGIAGKKPSMFVEPSIAGGTIKNVSSKDALEPLVGLWKVSFTDKSADFSDNGYITYHSDFTEFQNSERTPSTGAVCQGVWEKVLPNTYVVNHFALGYGDSVNLTNIIRIREAIVVDSSGHNFAGYFIQDVYDAKTHSLLVEYSGPMTGARIDLTTGIETQ